MLVLSRKIGELLKIGDDITITVLRVNGSQVQLGIDAPHAVTVHREEVWNRIQKSKPSQLIEQA